jgi:hypothetical protein
MVDSEALKRVRTMRDVRISLDVARKQKPRTTNSLFRSDEQAQSIDLSADRRLHQVLGKERKRFAAQEASLNQSRERLLAVRKRLAKTIDRNRALTDLRLELQQARCRGKRNVPPKTATTGAELSKTEANLHQISLRY